jgi:phage host-nuclease inhibitor protein Gam
MAGRCPLLIEEQVMQMKPYESGAAERAARSDPDLMARAQAIETVLPTLATRVQLEQLRGEMKEGFGAVRVALKAEIGALRAETKGEIGNLRAEMKDGFAAVNETIGELRAEMKDNHAAVNQTIGELRAEMKDGNAAVNQTIGELRAEIKEGLGANRAELYKTTADRHLETQGVIFGAIKWAVGFTFGLVGLMATVVAAVSPLIKLH